MSRNMGPFGTGPISVNMQPPAPRPRYHWWGVGIEVTAHAVIPGKRMLHGNLVTCTDATKIAEFHAQEWRFGVGLGVSGGGCALIALNIGNPNDLRAALSGGCGFELAAGANSKLFLKAFELIRRRLASLLAVHRAQAGIRAIAGYEQIGHEVLTALEGAEALKDGRAALLVLPVGAGLQASFHYAASASVTILKWPGGGS